MKRRFNKKLNDMIVVATVCIIVLMGILVLLWWWYGRKTERFGNGNTSLTFYLDSMNLSDARKQAIIQSMTSMSPVTQRVGSLDNKNQFYISETATLSWKQKFNEHKTRLIDTFIADLLTFGNTVFLFSDVMFGGHIAAIPFTGEMPMKVTDDYLFRTFIKWEPPVNGISAVVPDGFQVRLEFEKPDETMIIKDGMTLEFTINRPIKEMYIEPRYGS